MSTSISAKTQLQTITIDTQPHSLIHILHKTYSRYVTAATDSVMYVFVEKVKVKGYHSILLYIGAIRWWLLIFLSQDLSR